MVKDKSNPTPIVTTELPTPARPTFVIRLTAEEADMLATILVTGISWAESGAAGNFAEKLYDALYENGADDAHYKGPYHTDECRRG